jgi:hypothetical protein
MDFWTRHVRMLPVHSEEEFIENKKFYFYLLLIQSVVDFEFYIYLSYLSFFRFRLKYKILF